MYLIIGIGLSIIGIFLALHCRGKFLPGLGLVICIFAFIFILGGVIQSLQKEPVTYDYYYENEYDTQKIAEEVNATTIADLNKNQIEYVVHYTQGDSEEWEYHIKTEEATRFEKYEKQH